MQNWVVHSSLKNNGSTHVSEFSPQRSRVFRSNVMLNNETYQGTLWKKVATTQCYITMANPYLEVLNYMFDLLRNNYDKNSITLKNDFREDLR